MTPLHRCLSYARRQEGRGLSETVVLHAHYDQVEVVIRLQRSAVTHRPFLRDASPSQPAPRVEQFKVDCLSVLRCSTAFLHGFVRRHDGPAGHLYGL
jgi:hypothetical protein